MIYNYKIITQNLLLFLFVITIDLFIPTKTQALTFQTPLIEGQLVYGHLTPHEEIYVDSAFLNNGQESDMTFISRTSNGQFILGLPQDCTQLSLYIKTDKGIEKQTFPVQKRFWKEEVINGLPPRQVTPNTHDQKRIESEFLLMRKSRQHSDFTEFPTQWIRPLKQFKRISSEFGSRRLLNGIKTQGHSGTDYAAPIGTPVIAPAKGVIKLIHPDMFYSGQTILIDHGYGVFSSYSHLSHINVQENQIVQPGDKIGEVGMTGRATGPHLHFTVTWFGVRIDPETLFQKKSISNSQ